MTLWYYYTCSLCSSRWFGDVAATECPRCGKRADQTEDKTRAPWMDTDTKETT